MMKELIYLRKSVLLQTIKETQDTLEKMRAKKYKEVSITREYVPLPKALKCDMKNLTTLYASWGSLYKYYAPPSTESLSDIANENYASASYLRECYEPFHEWYSSSRIRSIDVFKHLLPPPSKNGIMLSPAFFDNEPKNLIALHEHVYNSITRKKDSKKC